MKHWFTLIEILLVITIIAILSTITLRFNWSKIQQMEGVTDKEQRSSRHRQYNNLFTNTNFRNNTKTPVIIFTYTGNTILLHTGNISTPLNSFIFKHHTIQDELTIAKTWLQLWCDAWTDIWITLLWPNNTSSCFTLDTSLCRRSQTEC